MKHVGAVPAESFEPQGREVYRMKIVWERINSAAVAGGTHSNQGGTEDQPHGHSYRTKVPGGWLVLWTGGDLGRPHAGMTFYPDPKHEWKGNSLP